VEKEDEVTQGDELNRIKVQRRNQALARQAEKEKLLSNNSRCGDYFCGDNV
jgi:hypothetical protein